MVALSIAPTLNNAEADEWMASEALLLNLRLAVMAKFQGPSALPFLCGGGFAWSATLAAILARCGDFGDGA